MVEEESLRTQVADVRGETEPHFHDRRLPLSVGYESDAHRVATGMTYGVPGMLLVEEGQVPSEPVERAYVDLNKSGCAPETK